MSWTSAETLISIVSTISVWPTVENEVMVEGRLSSDDDGFEFHRFKCETTFKNGVSILGPKGRNTKANDKSVGESVHSRTRSSETYSITRITTVPDAAIESILGRRNVGLTVTPNVSCT